MMTLGALATALGWGLRRDGPFGDLGILEGGSPHRLVALYDPARLDDLRLYLGIAAVLTTPELADAVPPGPALAVTPDPDAAMTRAHLHLVRHLPDFYWPSFPSQVDPDARVDVGVLVPERNVRIGPGAVVQRGAVLLERVIIGEGCFVGAGSVLGAESLQTRFLDGQWFNLPHGGGVRLHPRAVILSQTVVCAHLFGGLTEVGEGSIIDNRVMVGHGSRVGRNCRIAAGAIITGRVSIGDNVYVGPGAVLSNGITLDDGAVVLIGETITRDLKQGSSDYLLRVRFRRRPIPRETGSTGVDPPLIPQGDVP